MRRFRFHACPGLKSLLGFLAAVCPFPLHAEKTPPHPDVLIVADVLAEDPAGVQPSPGHPVYYFILGGKERDLGAPIGGMPAPDPQVLRAEIVGALAKRGFVQTVVGGPAPEIVIVYAWGHANLDTENISNTDAETGETTTTILSYNSREIAQLVGINKARRHLLSSSEADELNDAARNDRLYIHIAALDAPALRRKEKKLLWRTRISIDALHHTLPETMHVMLTSAAPFFAREEDRPVIVDDSLRRNATVSIPDFKVIETLPPSPQPEKR